MSLTTWIILAVIAWVVWQVAKRHRPPRKKPGRKHVAATLSDTMISRGDESEADDLTRDAWEGSFWEATGTFPVRAVLEIKYTDGSGQTTHRVVETRQAGGLNGDGIIIAHCRLRNATRTFLTQRIKSCVDTETGEVVKDVMGFLRSRYEASPEHSLDQLLEDEYDVLRVLLYVAKADGRLTAKEKSIVRETCRRMSGDSRITDKSIDDAFTSLGIPTLNAFKMAVGRITKRSDNAIYDVLKAAEAMVGTEKTIHASEQDALDYIRKRMAEHSEGVKVASEEV